MNKKNRQIYNNLKHGINIEESIPDYLEAFRELYKEFSELNLGMYYFMFYENYIASYNKMDARELDILNRLNKLISKCFHPYKDNKHHTYSNVSNEDDIKALEVIREDITKGMKILTNYTDILLIYDYVLKRIEFRFTDNLVDIDDELVTNEIINYIFETKDQVLINNKLSDVISQLPVRMSRYKYFDLISESFSLFEDMNLVSLESYLYMIRSSAMLYELSGMEDVFPELNSTKVELETSNYSDISQDEWIRLTSLLDETTDKINYLADYFYGLQEMANQLYIYLLNAKESKQTSNQEEAKRPMVSVICQVNHNFTNNLLNLSDETSSLLSETEGIQEELLGDISNMESVFSMVEDKYRDVLVSRGLEQSYDNLKKSQIFFTNSLFFEVNKAEDDRILTKAEINEEKMRLVSDIEDLFKKNSRYVNRAVMANTLNKIPGFLINQDEVLQHINSSLTQCRDMAEKKASIDIIQTFWE